MFFDIQNNLEFALFALKITLSQYFESEQCLKVDVRKTKLSIKLPLYNLALNNLDP